MTRPGAVRIDLELDLGEARQKALAYARANPDVLLSDFLRLFPARTRQPLPAGHLGRRLGEFQLIPCKLAAGEGCASAVAEPSWTDGNRESLSGLFDELFTAEVTAAEQAGTFPESMSDSEAVQVAYRAELQAIARFLRHDLSVLVVCDKLLTAHIYETVCARADRRPVLEEASDPAEGERRPGTAAQLDRALAGAPGPEANLAVRIRNLKDREVLILRSLDLLDTPSLIEVLYQAGKGGRRPQLLGFLDPSLEVKKVLTDRFAVHYPIMGLPRFIQPDPEKPPVHTVTRMLTAHERGRFQKLDPEGLYKNVSGLNAIQFRNAMRYVGATVADASESRHIHDVIRQFKRSSSSEIEIPDTTFDDIGGYERVKQELQRIIALASGRVEGLDDRARRRLIPRGFVFHGPPGTGKTLFAKAIANEMNATIQMVSGPEIMDKYVGQSESNLRHIFATARRNAPSVIVFDEFDSIASQRSTYSDGGSRANNAVVAQLLTELDGFHQHQAVMVIGTTNRLDIIDEALLRPARLKPVEINLPDYTARRSVAAIHARSFGVDVLIRNLAALALEHLDGWREDSIPPAFLEALFARHAPHRVRYESEDRRAGFLRDLREFYLLLTRVRDEGSNSGLGPGLARLEEDLRRRTSRYGLDVTQANLPALEEAGLDLQPMQSDLRELLSLLATLERPAGGLSGEGFLEGVLDLVAEYTDGFNNDEIRAVFQEASLEHLMDGQLVTPRYLGMKVGLIKKRRDEREVTHLSRERGRR